MTKQKNIPFPFILDYLFPLQPYIKPFFGCVGVYIEDKIVFILRDKKSRADSNGLWIATFHEHHKSLKREFPSLQSVRVLNNGDGETAWQMIHAEADDFEASAIHACELVLHGDPRIGKVPKPKVKKTKVK